MSLLHPISFARFERFVVTGELSRQGATADGHSLRLRSETYTGPDGQSAAATPLPMPTGSRLERVWQGHKPDNRAGFDHFEHWETARKLGPQRLEVCDSMQFHGGRTSMTRTYVAQGQGRDILREVGKWDLNLDGMSRFARPIARPIMLRRLEGVERSLRNLVQAEGLREREADPSAIPLGSDEAA